MRFLIIVLKYNIKLIYSATSANLGNKGEDKNIIPYALLKQKFRVIRKFEKWFNLRYE